MSVDIAIVTGGASGVGKATVELLASHGISVVAIDRAWPRDHPGSDAVERLTGDVVDDSTWSTALEVAERLGRPSMLVLNAAKLVVGTVLEVTTEQFRAVMEVNVIAAVKGLQATLPSMLSHGRGSIVGVASTNSLYAEQSLASYNSSKGALLQLIRSVAVDYARAGIRANAVCPGYVETEMTAAYLCGVTGIENRTIDNSAAYIANWLKMLSADRKLIIRATAQAQRACDYVLGRPCAD